MGDGGEGEDLDEPRASSTETTSATSAAIRDGLFGWVRAAAASVRARDRSPASPSDPSWPTSARTPAAANAAAAADASGDGERRAETEAEAEASVFVFAEAFASM